MFIFRTSVNKLELIVIIFFSKFSSVLLFFISKKFFYRNFQNICTTKKTTIQQFFKARPIETSRDQGTSRLIPLLDTSRPAATLYFNVLLQNIVIKASSQLHQTQKIFGLHVLYILHQLYYQYGNVLKIDYRHPDMHSQHHQQIPRGNLYVGVVLRVRRTTLVLLNRKHIR